MTHKYNLWILGNANSYLKIGATTTTHGYQKYIVVFKIDVPQISSKNLLLERALITMILICIKTNIYRRYVIYLIKKTTFNKFYL